MNQSTPDSTARRLCPCLLAALMTVLLIGVPIAAGGGLSVNDFKFDGTLGSQGATIEKIGENH